MEMSKRSSKTFRLAFLRKKISSTFKSQALKAALLAELNEGGDDAVLVIQMVERVRSVTNPPVKAVAPVPNPTAPQPGPAPVPRQAPAPAPVADGNSAESALDVLDSEDELVQDMLLTPRRERRLRDQLQSWRDRSSSSD